MRLKRLEILGFKSFAKKALLEFQSPITAVVGPNGSGKSNVAEALRFVLGEQSMKSMRGKRGEDLIFNGSKTMGRMGKASVSITFDNTQKIFPNIDFDEVVVTREVSRDGVNEYLINGSHVRLKDVLELLAYARIGSSGHHIISQGEADRVLLSNARERREMIEDALGLRVFYFKRMEAERKLEKTRENMKEAESLRRELAPHLRFLKKQMERVKEGEELRSRLSSLYREYLKREEMYVNEKRRRILADRENPENELRGLDGRIAEIRAHLEQSGETQGPRNELLRLEEDLRHTRARKDEISRAIGRLEGAIEVEERRLKKLRGEHGEDGSVSMKKSEFVGFIHAVLADVGEAEKGEDISWVRGMLARIRETVASFHQRFQGDSSAIRESEEEIGRLRGEKEREEHELRSVGENISRLEEQLSRESKLLEEVKEKSREEEKELYQLMTRRGEISMVLERLAEEHRMLDRATRDLETELGEAGVLIGRAVLDYSQTHVVLEEVMGEPREQQEDRRREIERAKIRLESLGIQGGDAVAKEFEETTERDQFLEKELLDLEASAASLGQLILELNEKLETQFSQGIEKINKQFREFFGLMFGGGVAELRVVGIEKRRRNTEEEETPEEAEGEEEEEETGIDIHVSLPHKKLRGLQMLSGGERALTSIALLFAISQVNPPPFMVLDETDAALDEANSRKYGDMLENLARFSQLIVITHNRETMGRAGVLYGVTMSSDAVSKLLSIKFEEAVQVAK